MESFCKQGINQCQPDILFHMVVSGTIKGLMPEGVAYSSRATSDTALMERFDAEALPHLQDIFRTATRILGDKSTAEDVSQEVYLQAWKSFRRFESGTNCRAWLYKILFHCVSHHRRRWYRFPQLKETEEFLEANLTAAEPVADHLTDQDILGALDGIPPDFRAVILLVDVEEFAYKEASEILAVPIGTVMSRLSRGRKLLKEQLAVVAGSYGIGPAAKPVVAEERT